MSCNILEALKLICQQNMPFVRAALAKIAKLKYITPWLIGAMEEYIRFIAESTVFKRGVLTPPHRGNYKAAAYTSFTF